MSKYKINLQENIELYTTIITYLSETKLSDENDLYKFLKKNTLSDGNLVSKSSIIVAYKRLSEDGHIALDSAKEAVLMGNVQMKKVRTVSGVTPVTVLTKPFPCPGQCIFCPNDVRMPKSYLSDEPGAQRAYQNKFDPYLQTFNRLVAFRNTGHSTDKVELLILGGTWSAYPESYQIWFVKRCFDAMNDFGQSYDTKMIPQELEMPFVEEGLEEIRGEDMSENYNRVISKAIAPKLKTAWTTESATWDDLFRAHELNEEAKTRCIGLVIETRPDEIDPAEIIKLRKLGATRVQIGIQSMDDSVLELNKRGHDVAKTREALDMLRQAGFKILAHWMPNLYGSSPDKDIEDFDKLFSDISIRPDEMKVYPCSLIESAELMKYYKEGLWKPYSHEELLEVVVHAIENTPLYCRLNRVIRDIPSTDIVVGNKKTNFRQIAENAVSNAVDIRSREVRDSKTKLKDLSLRDTIYDTNVSEEHFLEFVDDDNHIAGFLRLSIPTKNNFISELKSCAIIREVHVYGVSTELGKSGKKTAQHKGLGTKLVKHAMKVSKELGFRRIAVISSVGTRQYYARFGFKQKILYQIARL